jgi:hypothetical protein
MISDLFTSPMLKHVVDHYVYIDGKSCAKKDAFRYSV